MLFLRQAGAAILLVTLTLGTQHARMGTPNAEVRQ
jgi:hypothetical protein